MQGRHSQLAAACALAFENNLKQLAEVVCDHILYYQDVRNQFTDHFRVSLGSGMGCRHSGSLSDWAFYILAGRQLVFNGASADIGLLFYRRFRDDILAMCDSYVSSLAFLDRLTCAASSSWTIEKERLAGRGVPMLDIFIEKSFHEAFVNSSGNKCCPVRWKPYRKDTARHLPLHPASCHSNSVHRSWPQGEALRLWRNSCLHADFVKARDEFIDRLARNFMPDFVQNSVKTWVPRCPVAIPDTCPDVKSSRTVRLVMPYHPFLRSALGRLMSRFAERWAFIAPRIGCRHVGFGISFASAGRNISLALRSLQAA